MRTMAVACLVMGTPSTSALHNLVDAWSASAQAVLDLVQTLNEDDLDRATDLPGWTVRDIVAHLAHLESELAGREPVLASDDEIPEDARADPFRAYTEKGVAARRGRAWSELLVELEGAVATLRETLAVDPPPDPPASFPRPGATWAALLHDRVIDYWMHEQDIRQAVGRSGGWDSPGADVTIGSFWQALPFIVGKKVRPRPAPRLPGRVTTRPGRARSPSRWVTTGGRGPVTSRPTKPTSLLKMRVEDFVLACGGRRDSTARRSRYAATTTSARRCSQRCR
jgi:uncharacterized protein (TIGR03083 family)